MTTTAGAIMATLESWDVSSSGLDATNVVDVLAKLADIADVYASRRGIPVGKITEWMDAETWWSADEAVAVGMADRIVEAPVASGRGQGSTTFAEERSRLESMIAARANGRRVDAEFDRLQDQRREDQAAVAAVERRTQIRQARIAEGVI